MQTANDIRNTFLDYFARNGHTVVDSSPLVPRNDPTLMFTNAGMVQFKNVFTGQEERAYKRATTSQKVVRAGGKHNDLENVGYTARHHTFFEMLGNFSFGDYFKPDAIEFAWKLVTGEYGLPKDKLLVTVHTSDEEAAGLWRKIAGLPDDRIIRIPTSDNFWTMGDVGPCGPCTEIFYDHGPSIPGGPPGSPDEDGDRFIEIWNLVFMQFEQLPNGERINLPRPSIDTGMGLERITAVLQGTHDNYNIDLMRQLIEASAAASNTDPYGPVNVSHRVIADHLRCSGFLIADGVLPSNEGRGYVLRRIMRRAMRHAHMIGCTEPLLYRLVPALVRAMGGHYRELVRAEALITETLKLEETRFKQTLDRGLRLLDDETARLASGGVLPGEVAFKLYDTYGFPLDLTQDVLRGRGGAVDVAGFEAAMERQRAEARRNWAGSGEAATETVWFDIRQQLGATEFLGYEAEHVEGQVTALVVDGKRVEKAEAGQNVAVIVNQTAFYGESGGQVGDSGAITTEKGGKVAVTGTVKKLGDVFVHLGTVEAGSIAVGDAVDLAVDGERRSAIRANHSATHLLHAALREKLGEHVTQKGSLVDNERLRFDISHPKPIEAAEMAVIEAQVNARVRGNSEVVTRLMAVDEAIETGAMALFGEKYGEEVRVVTMGGPGATANRDFSVELCGGIHVKRTGDIGLFKVVSESAVAAGVRRIEAVTGAAAFAWFADREAMLSTVAGELKVRPEDVPSRVGALVEEKRRLERDLSDLRRKMATDNAGGDGDVREIAGVKLISRVLEDVPPKELKPMADELKARIGSGVAVLIAANDGKASIVVAVTDDVAGRFSAVDLVRLGAEKLGGKGGGGRPDMAQAGGTDPSQAGEAVEAIAAALGA
ncbi:alanine--tRNA ligase [Radicibacter daui]|uniref:alanine--tRNA ligase n=1 Tax=Radicibacter daui TaxID=3064829 RepID=UPI00404693E5